MTIIIIISVLIASLVAENIKLRHSLYKKEAIIFNKEVKLRKAEKAKKEMENNARIALNLNTELCKKLNEVSIIVSSNNYNNEKTILKKIRDLTRNYQR